MSYCNKNDSKDSFQGRLGIPFWNYGQTSFSSGYVATGDCSLHGRTSEERRNHHLRIHMKTIRDTSARTSCNAWEVEAEAESSSDKWRG